MLYFMDLEFIEDGKTIDLISIGIVAEDGREFYAINRECNFQNASPWVWDNVLYPIGIYSPIRYINPSDPSVSSLTKDTYLKCKTRAQIKEDLLLFFAYEATTTDFYTATKTAEECYENTQVWGEWCSYDWVCFAQLFGTMMDLPDGFPMRCRDVIQYAEDHLGIASDKLPPSLETDGNHNALLGAKTVKMRYEWLREQDQKLNGFN